MEYVKYVKTVTREDAPLRRPPATRVLPPGPPKLIFRRTGDTCVLCRGVQYVSEYFTIHGEATVCHAPLPADADGAVTAFHIRTTAAVSFS
jgi:hypothetical protein